jgi:hypothetical protein
MSAETLLFALGEAMDANLVYLVACDGTITPMRWTLYQALPADDPRLVCSHVALSRRHAEAVSRQRRGLPTGFEMQQIHN